MKRVAIYLRVSTTDQSVLNQRRELIEAAQRHGWQVVAEYADEGVSGAKGRDKRPGFDRLCKTITRREVDLVAAWSVDRLGRSLQHLRRRNTGSAFHLMTYSGPVICHERAARQNVCPTHLPLVIIPFFSQSANVLGNSFRGLPGFSAIPLVQTLCDGRSRRVRILGQSRVNQPFHIRIACTRWTFGERLEQLVSFILAQTLGRDREKQLFDCDYSTLSVCVRLQQMWPR